MVLAFSMAGSAMGADNRIGSAGERAGDILRESGVRGGLVVHVGCGDGKLTAALRVNERYVVQGLDADAANVSKAREHIRSVGTYGNVSVDGWSGGRLPYAENLVNLLVVEDAGSLSLDEMLRVLAPRGVAMLRAKDKEQRVKAFRELGARVEKKGEWLVCTKPVPEEMDEWTHYLHDSTNNAVAKDSLVGPPKRYQWIAGPKWARSHDHLATVSAAVSANGRIFYIVDEGPAAAAAVEAKWFLVARDAFNGVLLWKRPVGPWEGHLRDFRTGPTELARRLVAVGERVYVTLGYGKPVTALDAATGETVRTYNETKHTMEIIHRDGTLFLVVGDRLPDNTGGAAKPVGPKNIWHWWPIYEDAPPRKHIVAVDAATGTVKWTKSDADTVEMLPSTLAAAGGRIFFQSYAELLALDAKSGEVDWRAPRPVNRHRMTWSTPTVVVYGDVVLSGDRAVDAPVPGVPESEKPSQWVVTSQGGNAPPGLLIAFNAATGERLWEAECREGYNSPVDVLVADGLVWSGSLVSRKDPGITRALDVRTGEEARTRSNDQEYFQIKMGHHRCYRNKATEKYLVLGRDGVELIDLATGEGHGNQWTRGACQYGVMPCNGLIYFPPHSCACHIESKINSFNALAPETTPAESKKEKEQRAKKKNRLVKGPAFGKIPHSAFRTPHSKDWPTYRHDAARSGAGGSRTPAQLKRAWKTNLNGNLSALVVGGGKCFVASVDAHTVHALDVESGDEAWRFTAGGRVDSPPTLYGGTAIFGCNDGWIYCVRAADGELVWRYRAALEERRIIAYGQLESPWPVHGSVLVQDDAVYAVAGRTPHLDGGMSLIRLDAKTGAALSQTPIEPDALPDVLSSDGENIFMRHNRFDSQGVKQTPNVKHLYSAAGFLDGSWWHRTYWLVGTAMSSGWGSWPNSAMRAPAGRIMALDGGFAYGFGRLNQYHRNGIHVGLGQTRNLLYASALEKLGAAEKSGQAQRRGKKPPPPNQVPTRWSRTVPMHARGMAASGGVLFVAGPPDVLEYAGEDVTDPYHTTSAKSIAEHGAALAGKRGATLLAVATEDGCDLAEYRLDSPPVWDGLAVASDRLFFADMDGNVLCYKGK